MSADAGHLFVVHGRIESLVHDAAIIPVDQAFHFNRYWKPLVGSKPQQPDRWHHHGWGRVCGCPDRVWAASIGGSPADPYDVILDRITECLASIDRRRSAHRTVRGEGTRPLVAVPVVGIGLGGYAADRGTVLRSLVERLASSARELDVDVALVTPDPAVYAAAQYARRDQATDLSPALDQTARELGRQSRSGELALFLGAGVAVPAGLPTWHTLISELAAEFGVRDLGPRDAPLTVTDQAELIERAANGRFQQRIAEMVGAHRRPSLLHALLAGLDCREVVTTNYDLLYEQAVAATHREITSVMPWASAQGAERWILKLHGDVNHPNKIVLTRRHMIRYDALNRPSGSILQTLLLTKQLLIVGASMSDDNVVRLAHEVQNYRTDHQDPAGDTFGTVLDAGGDRVRKTLWDDQLDWLLLPELGPWTGPRAVELLLDRIALHAARNSSWLLDPRFDGLLDDDSDRQLASQVRALYRQIPRREGNKWWPLIKRLEELGVDTSSA